MSFNSLVSIKEYLAKQDKELLCLALESLRYKTVLNQILSENDYKSLNKNLKEVFKVTEMLLGNEVLQSLIKIIIDNSPILYSVLETINHYDSFADFSYVINTELETLEKEIANSILKEDLQLTRKLIGEHYDLAFALSRERLLEETSGTELEILDLSWK